MTIETSTLVDSEPASRADPALPGFHHGFRTIDGLRLHYVSGGDPAKPTLVLLAGFPQSWFAWRHVMALLADRFHIIAPDLPGQGDSDRPHDGYDTRTVATRVHALLEALGQRRYALAGHDVGAWVAYPLAALHPDAVERLALLDAGIPGITLPEALPTAPDRAWRTWHFSFHMIPDLPEMLITGRERAYLDWFLRRKTANPETFSDATIDEYLRVFVKDGGLRAGLAFYRATTVSAGQNRALSHGGKLPMPVLAVGADQGSIADMAGPLRTFAETVHGRTMSFCGHFIPEEQPAALARELASFFAGGGGAGR
ncbi:alpha/beta fold hydrolase [Azospirillum sp. ST 5-10]|uniref:alpha/beta fold hydrolase n=1 Tax=unclassified Azospirillum TaxID=2630922 RepID=UPI003F4A19BB